MTFEAYKKSATKRVENTNNSIYFVQEYYIDDIAELLEKRHCKCKCVSCGFSQKLSAANAMIRKRYANLNNLFEYRNSSVLFIVSECNYNHLISSYNIWDKNMIQHWSTDYLGKGIEHCRVQAFKGRNNRDNKFNIGDKVGVLSPLQTEVSLGEIVGLPPSLKEVYDFREQYREQLKIKGDRFIESEILCSDHYPLDAYIVRIKMEEVALIQPTLLIPLSNQYI